jgi:PBP1b-binding outer membrane lipoprotein LpoB
MKNLILIVTAALLFIGCSKDGAKARLLNGSDPSDITHTPTDTNMPEIGDKPAAN